MANTSLRVTETDFDTIKQNLKTYLKGQSQFQDFDFEGSGMSVLLDILAYNTHYMAYYLNMVANESFLDTAQIRSSVVSHAKTINYVPESAHAATTKLNILVTPSGSESDASVVTLDRYTRLLGTDIDGVNYPFVTKFSNTASKSSGTFSFANVHIQQGEVISLQYLVEATNTKRRYGIPSANVDTDTISVYVQQSTSNTSTTEYMLVEDFTELTSDSEVYFIEEDLDGSYVVYFGDGVLGKRPSDGNVIIISYLDTVGSAANKISAFNFVEPIGGLFSDNVSITAISSTYGGSEREPISEVKFHAPYSYVSQNRAVTRTDYETLITRDYNFIDSIAVWGGEENDPPIYGKVFLSLKTKGNYYLTNAEKENIKNSLIESRNIMTVIPEIVDPIYTYILVREDVYYSPEVTSSTSEAIKALAVVAVEDYRDDELNKFNAVFRKSKLQQYIEGSDKSITGSDVKIFFQKRVDLTLNQTKNYELDFAIPIKKGDIGVALYSYPQVTVVDSNFTEREIFFEEIPSVASGVSEIEIQNPGINFTTAPTISISGDGTGATAVARIAGGRIDTITVTNPGTGYSRAVITITGDGSEAQARAVLESRIGRLRTYYINTNGIKTIVNDNAGTINYETGKIVLTSLTPTKAVTSDYYGTNVLTINVPIVNDVVHPERNLILDIDVNDPQAVQIDIVAET